MSRRKALLGPTGCTSGSVAVEFALIGIIMMMLLLGTIEFGRGLYIRNEMAFASDLVARRVLIDAQATDAELEALARASVIFGSDLSMTFGTTTLNGDAFRTILMTYPLSLMVPGLADGTVTLRVQRRIPI